MSRDTLQILNEFGNRVCKALNDAAVGSEENEDVICAIMLIVGQPETSESPIGSSLNFDPKKNLWEVTPQVTEGEACELDEEF